MPTAAAIQNSFNSGELSPMLDGRVDFNKYPNAGSIMENFIPTVPGPAKRRGGTRFIAETKDSSKRSYFQRFEFSVEQAYMLEFGENYVRFYTWDPVTKVRGRLEVGGVPVEVVTPYSSASLFNADGTSKLRFAQSADVLYITHPQFPVFQIRRTSAIAFTGQNFVPKNGPFKALNTTATTVYASGATGSVTLIASAGIFNASMVGQLVYLESGSIDSVRPWEVGQTVAVGDIRRSDGKNYQAATAGTTGSNRPVHTEGTLYDGSDVSWTYLDPGYGNAQITAYTSPTQVTANVLSRLPAQVVGSGNASARWAFGEWSASDGYPNAIALHRERMWFARGQKIWSSVSSDFSDFSAQNFGTVTDDMAISLTIASGNINDVQWLISEKSLLAGTAGGELSIGELDNGSPLSPSNIRVRQQSQYGSRSIQPIVLGESTLFIQRAGLKAREIFYDFGSDGYKSTDTTVLADHISLTGITDIDLAQEPDPVVWATRADGKLLGFTWNNEQDVRGWHRHPLGGDGFVESVATMPAAEGDRNEVWMIVRRTINGVTKRYVEYMDRPWRRGDPLSRSFYMDCGLTYNGSPTTSISGLSHLEGQTVDVLVDGAPHPQRVVTGGAITLQIAGSVVSAGLPAPCRWRSMRPEAGAANGTAQGKTKRISKLTIRMLDTGGGRLGANETTMETLQFRTGSDLMNQPVPLFSGDKTIQWPQGYDTDCYMEYTNDQPLPCTLVAIMPIITTQDAR